MAKDGDMEHGARTRQFLSLALAGVVACICLLMLPPGIGSRIQGLVRCVAQPAQAWSDCGVRVSRALLGTSSEVEGEETLEELRQKVAACKLEVRTARAGLDRVDVAARRLGIDLSVYRRDYTLALGRVIRRDPLVSYYDTLMLDLGTKVGVKVGQYVVSVPQTKDEEFPRLVGIVRSVSATSSVVELVSHAGVAIPCTVPSRGLDAVLMGYEPENEIAFPALGRHGGRLVLSHLLGDVQDNVQAGDRVYTSGMGGNAYGLAGLYVGKVREIQLRDDGSPAVFLEPSVALTNLSHVLVVLGRERKP